ncbi:MAG: hypothetical protein AABX29_01785 [Nanoarchaeota archaeon]
MRKIISLLFILLFLIGIVYADQLEKGSTIEVGGKKVLLKGIAEDSVVVSVDGVSNIIEQGETKTINGIKIIVGEVFYSDLGSQADISAESIYSCGDGNCDETETSDNCCNDCGCKNGLECNDNKCREKPVNKCNSDAECNDNDSSTEDKCTGSPKECKHIGGKICEKNEDCDDDNECTKDECKNSDCFNAKTEDCVSNLTDSEMKNTNTTGNKSRLEQEVDNFLKERESFMKKIINFFKRIFFKGD